MCYPKGNNSLQGVPGLENIVLWQWGSEQQATTMVVEETHFHLRGSPHQRDHTAITAAPASTRNGPTPPSASDLFMTTLYGREMEKRGGDKYEARWRTGSSSSSSEEYLHVHGLPEGITELSKATHPHLHITNDTGLESLNTIQTNSPLVCTCPMTNTVNNSK